MQSPHGAKNSEGDRGNAESDCRGEGQAVTTSAAGRSQPLRLPCPSSAEKETGGGGKEVPTTPIRGGQRKQLCLFIQLYCRPPSQVGPISSPHRRPQACVSHLGMERGPWSCSY